MPKASTSTERKPRIRGGIAARTALLLAAVGLASCSPPRPENLVFVSLDTTRRDHLPTYGYPRDTAPHLDRLARRSVVFTHAVAQMTITNPSHASMFTGLYPHTHKVGENTRRLGEEHVTLAEILAAAGFRTAAFVSGHPLRAQITGIDQGFEIYDSDFRRRRDGRVTTERALGWLASRRPGERFFLFVHLYDAHGPYRPEPAYLNRFRSPDPGAALDFIPSYQQLRDEEGERIVRLGEYVDRYDAQIRYMDDLVGELLAALDLSRTVVVVVADHGETLGERATPLNLNHGTSVFEEQIAIPLILHAPGLGAGSFERLTETVDLLPTLLAILRLPVPAGLTLQGQSLLPLLTGSGRADGPLLAFASNRGWSKNFIDRGYRLRDREFIHSVRWQHWKLIAYPGVEGDYLELYDLRRDPGERHDVAARHPEIRDRLRRTLDLWRREDTAEAPEAELTPEDRELLRSLGYL